MKIPSLSASSYLLSMCLLGCMRTSDLSTPAAPGVDAAATLERDDEKSVAALTAVAAKLKRDRDGYVIEVDFRGTSIGDDALQHLSGLRHVRVVLLSATAITDVGANELGKISTLRDVDLRDCPISNAGIAPLSKLAELRALRLSGKNGNTTVDDEAFGDIAKMTKLKVLVMDDLWVGSEGLSQLTDQTELEELYLGKTLVDDEALALLAQFPKLKKLRVSQNQVTSQCLAHLVKLPQLLELDIS